MPRPRPQRFVPVIGALISGATTAQPVDAAREFDALRQRMIPRITENPPAVGEAQVTELLGAAERIKRRPQASRWRWEKGAEQGWGNFAGDPRKVIEWRSR